MKTKKIIPKTRKVYFYNWEYEIVYIVYATKYEIYKFCGTASLDNLYLTYTRKNLTKTRDTKVLIIK